MFSHATLRKDINDVQSESNLAGCSFSLITSVYNGPTNIEQTDTILEELQPMRFEHSPSHHEDREDPFHASSDEDETWEPPKKTKTLTEKLKESELEKSYQEKQRSRKKARKPETWKRSIKKSKVNHGESYTSSSGKQIEERKVKIGCNEKCSFKCSLNIDNVKRHTIFQQYWGLGNIDRQREFLLRHMEKIEPTYRYAKTNRGKNFKYFFKVERQDNKSL